MECVGEGLALAGRELRDVVEGQDDMVVQPAEGLADAIGGDAPGLEVLSELRSGLVRRHADEVGSVGCRSHWRPLSYADCIHSRRAWLQAVVLLSELLTSSRVKVPLESTTKDDLLAELVGVLARERCIRDADEVLRVIREREAVLSTGIGSGVAIPHGKSLASPELSIAAGVARTPVEYDALDGEPVQLVFLLVGPEAAAGAHIKALSRISRLVRQPELRTRLLEAVDSQDFIAALREAEIG